MNKKIEILVAVASTVLCATCGYTVVSPGDSQRQVIPEQTFIYYNYNVTINNTVPVNVTIAPVIVTMTNTTSNPITTTTKNDSLNCDIITGK